MGRPGAPLPGERLGFPLYHAITGNLPVLSTKFHRPRDAAPAAVSEYELWTGNLPVLSRDLARSAEEDLCPGWVPLIDPITLRQFWWNSFHRSRRETRPLPHDDGRLGANLGELEGKLLAAAFMRVASPAGAQGSASPACVEPGKTWQELHAAGRSYYWNRRTNETTVGVSTSS
jgi:hypothetical protein